MRLFVVGLSVVAMLSVTATVNGQTELLGCGCGASEQVSFDPLMYQPPVIGSTVSNVPSPVTSPLLDPSCCGADIVDGPPVATDQCCNSVIPSPAPCCQAQPQPRRPWRGRLMFRRRARF